MSTVRTNHEEFGWIPNMMDKTGKFTRCRLRLLKFEYDAMDRAGIKYEAVDVFSLLQKTGNNDSPFNGDVIVPRSSVHSTSDHRSPNLTIIEAKYS